MSTDIAYVKAGDTLVRREDADRADWWTRGKQYVVESRDGELGIESDDGDFYTDARFRNQLHNYFDAVKKRSFTVGDVKTVEPASPEVSDAIYQPHHYARYTIEPITFINANKLPPNIANVIKYSCRYDAKNGIEDLEKAKRYLDIQIECIKRDARVEAGESAADVWKVAL